MWEVEKDEYKKAYLDLFHFKNIITQNLGQFLTKKFENMTKNGPEKIDFCSFKIEEKSIGQPQNLTQVAKKGYVLKWAEVFYDKLSEFTIASLFDFKSLIVPIFHFING